MSETTPTLREYAAWLYSNRVQCTCDLDRWEPERSTGHSWVCRIHKEAVAMAKERRPLPVPTSQETTDA
jgi:hypothetical protein